MNVRKNGFYFFVGGKLSQFYNTPIKENGLIFATAEHYMHYRKAILFHDHDTAKKILRTTNPFNAKKLGRTVKNFSSLIWDEKKYDIVKHGNILKFSQNNALKMFLMSSDSLKIVEARRDYIWGSGCDLKESMTIIDEKMFPGNNLLGKILTEVRNEFKKDTSKKITSTIIQSKFSNLNLII